MEQNERGWFGMFTSIDRIQLGSGVNAMLGMWLAISPWVLRYTQDQFATGVSIGLGVIVTGLGLVRAYVAYRAAWLSWINALAGAIAVLAPWAFAYALDPARTNSVVIGAAVLVLAVWSALAIPRPFEI